MILYTLVPMDLVLEGMEEHHPHFKEIEIDGIKLLVEQKDINQCRVERILSTDPQDYLNSHLQPGSVVNFVPEIESLVK